MSKINYTWEQFDKACEKIAQWAQGLNFTGIFGIPRNGLVVAVRLSHLLGIPLIDDHHDIDGKDTLVVDDLVKTGETVSILEDHIGDFMIATLFWSGARNEPNYFCHKTKDEIIFPWERKADLIDAHPTARAIAMATQANLGGSIRVGKKGEA